jgi:pantetheine-phosphate adenylyltransferase
MGKLAIYPGSFDPITNGHLDVVRRVARLYSRVIVAVAQDADKATLFTLDERVALVRQAVRGLRNVSVEGFGGLLVKFAQRKKAAVIVRGLRAVSDFEYELQLALFNREMDSKIETIFLTPKEELAFVSSRMVKQIVVLGGEVNSFVPRAVEQALKRKLRAR